MCVQHINMFIYIRTVLAGLRKCVSVCVIYLRVCVCVHFVLCVCMRLEYMSECVYILIIVFVRVCVYVCERHCVYVCVRVYVCGYLFMSVSVSVSVSVNI